MGSKLSATDEVQDYGVEIRGLCNIFGKHPERYKDAVAEINTTDHPETAPCNFL